jgi:predicted small metal-binding protein
MTKTLSCRDVGVDCDWSVTGNSDQEILAKAAEHGKKVHGMNSIPPEIKQKILSAIKSN